MFLRPRIAYHCVVWENVVMGIGMESIGVLIENTMMALGNVDHQYQAVRPHYYTIKRVFGTDSIYQIS